MKRLILMLHTGTDALLRSKTANLFNDLVLLSNNLALMIEGAPSLKRDTARIPNITSTWGQKVGGVLQVLIAGHLFHATVVWLERVRLWSTMAL